MAGVSSPDAGFALRNTGRQFPALSLVRSAAISGNNPSGLLAGIVVLASLFQWLSTAPVPAQGALGMGTPLHLSWEASQSGTLPGVSSGWRGEGSLHQLSLSLPRRNTSRNSSASSDAYLEDGKRLYLVLGRLLL